MYTPDQMHALLTKAAGQMTDIQQGDFKEECPIGIIDIENWEWPQGVGMYGLYRYYAFSYDEKTLRYLQDWYDRHLEQGLPARNVNTTAPMLTLAFLYEHTHKEDYLALCEDWADWVVQGLPRTRDGGFQHVVTGHANEQQLWDDTLFMAVLFLAKVGRLTGRADYVEEAVHQFLVHIKYLFDKETGLWFHGWSFVEKGNFARAHWARGNCWVTAGIPDFLEITGLQGGVRRYLLDTLAAQVEALAALQAENGMWHTLLDDPGSYVETSATAGFAYGILRSVRLGYVDAAYRRTGERALEAVLARVGEDGTVAEVSYGTGMGRDLDFYRQIPCCPMTYGQALAILAICEGLEPAGRD